MLASLRASSAKRAKKAVRKAFGSSKSAARPEKYASSAVRLPSSEMIVSIGEPARCAASEAMMEATE
jgi:hypothetical protein